LIEEWLDVMNGIIGGLKDKNEFPEWYEGLHKALFRANEFLDERAVSKEEFANMLISWDIEEAHAEKAYDFITDHGKKHMDCMFIVVVNLLCISNSLNFCILDNLFSEFMKKFFLNETPKHPLNLGLD